MSAKAKGDDRPRMVMRIDGVVTAYRRDGKEVPYEAGAAVTDDCEWLIGDTGIEGTQESVTREDFESGRIQPKRMPVPPKPKLLHGGPPHPSLQEVIAEAVASACGTALARKAQRTKKGTAKRPKRRKRRGPVTSGKRERSA